jgi:hypothetical protein
MIFLMGITNIKDNNQALPFPGKKDFFGYLISLTLIYSHYIFTYCKASLPYVVEFYLLPLSKVAPAPHPNIILTIISSGI